MRSRRQTRVRTARGSSASPPVEREQIAGEGGLPLDWVEGGVCRVGEGVQVIGVLTELVGGASQRLPDARPEVPLEVRERPAGLHPQVCRVVVHRVVPPGQVGGLAQGPCVAPGDTQERAAEDPSDGRHTGQGAGAGAPGQAEQDLLGLVVTGVTEQDEGGAESLGDTRQRGIPGVAGGDRSDRR